MDALAGILRPRSIVERAAGLGKNRYTREWLRRDEGGAWEKLADACVREKTEEARKLGLSDEMFAGEVARHLVLLALDAQIARHSR